MFFENILTRLWKMSNHNDCRSLVRLICMKKAKTVKINQGLLEIIRKHVLNNYDTNDSQMPNSMCVSSRILITNLDKGESVILPDLFDFSSIHLLRLLRSNSAEACKCQICEIAKFNPIGKQKDAMPGNKRGRPPSRPQPNIIAGPQAICKKCFSIIGRGLTHDCKLKHRTENLIKSLNIPPIVQEKIASSIIKEKMKSVSETTVSLKTGGKPLRISPNIHTCLSFVE